VYPCMHHFPFLSLTFLFWNKLFGLVMKVNCRTVERWPINQSINNISIISNNISMHKNNLGALSNNDGGAAVHRSLCKVLKSDLKKSQR
jgi:hypothetical protein